MQWRVSWQSLREQALHRWGVLRDGRTGEATHLR